MNIQDIGIKKQDLLVEACKGDLSAESRKIGQLRRRIRFLSEKMEALANQIQDLHGEFIIKTAAIAKLQVERNDIIRENDFVGKLKVPDFISVEMLSRSPGNGDVWAIDRRLVPPGGPVICQALEDPLP
jgi:hypothetical protein